MNAIRRIFANIVCGFIPNKARRRTLRVVLNADVSGCIRFIKRDLNRKKLKHVKIFAGYSARNLIISVDKEFVYKFPMFRSNSNKLALREKRVVDALAPLSPIYVPQVELLQKGKDIVRKYEYIDGVTLGQMNCDTMLAHIKDIAPQIAKFIYTIACADPVAIRDLKPTKNAKPGYHVGWCHGDISDNFIINPETFKVIAFIDWEDASFFDFSPIFTSNRISPRRELMLAVSREYDKLYNAKKAKKSR